MKIPFPGPIPWLLYASPLSLFTLTLSKPENSDVGEKGGGVCTEGNEIWVEGEGVKHNGKEEGEGS